MGYRTRMYLWVLHIALLVHMQWAYADSGIGPYRMRMVNYTQCQGVKSHRHTRWNGTLVHHANKSDGFNIVLKTDKRIGPLSFSAKIYTWKDNAFRWLFKMNFNDPCFLLKTLALRESVGFFNDKCEIIAGEHSYYVPDFNSLIHARRDSNFYGQFMYAVQVFTSVDQIFCGKFTAVMEKI